MMDDGLFDEFDTLQAEIAAKLAQGYRLLRERGRITEADLAAALDALGRADELTPAEFERLIRGGVAA